MSTQLHELAGDLSSEPPSLPETPADQPPNPSRRHAFLRLVQPSLLLEEPSALPPLSENETVQELVQRYDETRTVAIALSGDAHPKFVHRLDTEREGTALNVNKPIRRRKFLRAVGLTAMVAGYSALAVKLGLRADEVAGQMVWQSGEDNPEYKDVYEVTPPEVAANKLRHGTFVFGGFGVKDATPIAEALKDSLGTQGRVFGMNYDNGIGIQIPYLAKVVSDQIQAKGLTEISFYGHSMGGDVALRVAIEVLRQHPGVSLRNLDLDCTPSGEEAIRSTDKNRGTFLRKVQAELHVEGGIVVRTGIELMNSPNTDFVSLMPYAPYIDITRLIDRIKVLKDEKLNSYAASNKLLLEQLDTIISMNVQDVFEELARLTEGQEFAPEITMYRPSIAEQDKTVFVDLAEKQYRTVAAEAGINFSTVQLFGNDVHHADPRALHDQYNRLLNAMFESQAESRRMLKESRSEIERIEEIVTVRALGKQQNGLGPNGKNPDASDAAEAAQQLAGEIDSEVTPPR